MIPRRPIHAGFALLLASVALLGPTGCRNRAAQELLERDLRDQEDRIYQLEDQLDTYKALYEQSRQQLNDVKRQPASSSAGTMNDDGPSAPSRRRITLPPHERQPFAPPTITLPGDDNTPPFKGPPTIQPPDPNIPEGEAPKLPLPTPMTSASQNSASQSNDANRVRLEPAGVEASAPVKIELPASTDVAMITFNGQQTGPFNADGQPGDEGVTMLLEPHSADGALIERPAAVAIVVFDPAMQGDAARVARWNFTAEEVAKRWRASTQGQGLWFELRWPNNLPRHRALTLHARYTTSDGRRLDAQMPVDIEPPAAIAQRPAVNMTPAVRPAPAHQPRAMQQPTSRHWTRATHPLPRPAPLQPAYVEPQRVEPQRAERETPLVILEDPNAPPARERALRGGRDDDAYLPDAGPTRRESPTARTAEQPRRTAPSWSPYR